MSKHFTKPPPKAEGRTRIIKDPPLKVSRAHAGSMGKSVKEELVARPNNDWEVPLGLTAPDGKLSGFYLWAGEEGIQPFAQLKQIAEATNEKELPEMLADEDEVIRNAAEEKLRELKAAKAKQPELRNE